MKPFLLAPILALTAMPVMLSPIAAEPYAPKVGRPHVAFTLPDIETDALISFPTTPLLPGRQELPGYYGRAFSYDYQGPYYGGPYESYFFRLPYACGVYGYC